MTIEFELPAAPATLTMEFVREHQLRSVPSFPPTWETGRTIRPGDRTPVIQQGNGTVRVVEAVWGRRNPEGGDLMTSIDGAGLSSAWQCLVPMTSCNLDADLSSAATPNNHPADQTAGRPEWFFAAGFLQPETAMQPASVLILRRPSTWRPLVIGRRHWLTWLDPQTDTRWLHGMSGSDSLVRA